MRHVFVETNWVVDVIFPTRQVPAAVKLIEDARAGRLKLYLPALCLTEARRPLQSKSRPRPVADSLRHYLKWAEREGKTSAENAKIVRSVLDQYESAVSAERDTLDERLRDLAQDPTIEVFALSDEMLARASQLAAIDLRLDPFDQAILAAVLVKAEQLRDSGADNIVFCEQDSDLQPWDNKRNRKQPLTSLYDAAQIWVYGDFTMKTPPKPSEFPV